MTNVIMLRVINLFFMLSAIMLIMLIIFGATYDKLMVRIHRRCGVGDFAERCDFKIEKSISNRNCQRQVFIVLTPV
jgi:hypothetical protein